MSIVLKNGNYYIAVTDRGKIWKTQNIEDAQTFSTCNMAMRKVFKYKGKCKGYYPYDTEDTVCTIIEAKRRKTYSKEERKMVYDKADGYCALCGCKLQLSDATLDHIIPLSMGGVDDLSNIQLACLPCNQFKKNILPDEFYQRIKKIFVYQMEKKKGNSLKWKIVRKMLEEMVFV
jgi:5-methylcytosine-specific restriction endonuclease McrA